VTSHSQGMIAIYKDPTRYINSIIIPKNQPIPAQHMRPYRLALRSCGNNYLEVVMTQGETDDPLQCTYLGMYVFHDIPAVAGAQAILDISYAYDKNGVVNVSAVERTTGQPLSVTVQ